MRRHLDLLLAALGISALIAGVISRPSDARSAAAQNWSAFVLVAGLLLIGLAANDDGLFAAVGHRLARLARGGVSLYLGATAMVALVTALLNLDTSVAFLTPVLIYTARSRGGGQVPLLYGCLLLSNAGSLFLPGSNLTNLIVLGHLHINGGRFLATMWLPALAALLVTAAVVAAVGHRDLRVRSVEPSECEPLVIGLGLGAVVIAAVLVVVLRSPALPVAALGVAVTVFRLAQGKEHAGHVAGVLGVPVLVGLFGIAVGLGTLGRAWSGPAALLSHLDQWGTAMLGAALSVLFNNLPAASLLAARTPPHPYALLVGLNLGPNLFVTGSLAWVLWLRSARAAGAQPSIATAARLGAVAVPLSMAAAVGLVILTGAH